MYKINKGDFNNKITQYICINVIGKQTSAVWLGSKRNSVVKYMQHLGMEWNPPKFKVLGIWFTSDLDNCEKKITTQKSLQK